MNYIDKNGHVIKQNSKQDKLLAFLYTHKMGRIFLKPLVQPIISKAGGWLLNQKCSAVGIPFIVKKQKIELSQYEKQKFCSYNDFFTRKIKTKYRPIQGNENILISPCDGKLSVYPINETQQFSIKHTTYTIESLLRSRQLAKHYKGGYACMFRLTVSDYHRFCYIDNGKKSKNRCISGVFHTVNPIANDVYPIYKENTREYSLLKSEHFKTVLMMEVGALLVGKIVNYHEDCQVKKGQEKGRFEFGGSTIILLFQKDAIQFEERLLKNTENGYETIVTMGECIGSAVTLSAET